MIPYNKGSYGIIIDNSLSNYIEPTKVYYECPYKTDSIVSENNCIYNKDNIISKLFINKYNDFYKENKNYEIVSEIDPHNTFTYKIIKLSEYKILLDELKKIINIKQNHNTYKYLNIYEITMIKADISLLDYLKNKTNTIMFKNNFKKQFLKLLDGIKKLHNNDFVHLDLKETNIMVSNDNLYLIDFGISDYTYNIFYSKYMYIFKNVYLYFPFETKIIYNVYNEFNTYDYEKTTVKEILDYINNTNFIDLYFNDYYNIIEEYNNQDKNIFKSQIKDFINDLIYRNNILNNNKLDFQLCMKYIFENVITKIDIYSIGIILYNLEKYLPKTIEEILQKLIDISPYNRPSIDELILMMKKSYI